MVELKSLSQNADIATGGSTITLTGLNFASGITAKINGVACTTSTYVSSTSMTCVVPSAGAGTFAQVDVSVTNPGPQTSTLTSSFFYLGAPRGWYSADVGVTQSSNAVSSWTDRSGNSNTLTQTTAGNKPQYQSSSSVFGSKPAIAFTGTQFMKFADLTVTKSISGATYMAAISANDLGGWNFFAYSTSSDNEIIYGGLNIGATPDISASPGMVYTGGARTDVVWQVMSGGSYTVNTPFLVSSVTDFSATKLSLYKDRSLVASSTAYSTAGTTPAVNASATYTYLGGGDGVGFNGQIPEFLLYNTALSDPNRQLVETYLKARYNTP